MIGAKPVTLHRYDTATTRDSRGEAVVAEPTESTIDMSVQPLNGVDMESLPEGERSSDNRKGYTYSELRTVDQYGQLEADHITAGGIRYIVRGLFPYDDAAPIPHHKAVLVRIDEADGRFIGGGDE